MLQLTLHRNENFLEYPRQSQMLFQTPSPNEQIELVQFLLGIDALLN